MLEIKPIQTKEEQVKIAASCASEYTPDAMAYAARENGTLLGICQFRIMGEYVQIYCLDNTIGITDYEALILMGRAALNFVDLCGVHIAECNALRNNIQKALGFLETDGKWRLNLTGYFDSKCGDH